MADMTLEEQIEILKRENEELSQLKTENDTLKATNKSLKGDLKKAKETPKEKTKEAIFEVDGKDDDGKDAVLKYRFTCPKFILDNVEYAAEQVVSDQKKSEVLAKLVAMNSGIIELVN
jgi:endonuclease III-like uncharacterized protein